MKKVISSTELRNKMNEAIDLLCDTVKTTLGPKCNNIIIDHSAFTPFITNDGVTIANNIESDDEVINTILSLAKESSINTNDLVGDGTTTTLVLLQSIYKNGIKELENISPIILKDELFETLTTITQMIKDLSFPSSKDKIFSIAKTSSNSTEIGRIIRDAYIEVNNKNLIKITESPDEKTNIIYKNGYIIDSLLSSPYFLKDKNSINIKNALILIINNYLDNIDDIANILNEIIKTKTPSIILAEDYSDTFTNEIINLNMQDINQKEFKDTLNNIDVSNLASKLNTDIYTLEDIIKELLNPGLDPRDNLDAPILKSDILHIEDLKKGMELQGTVRNVASFGAFIDIGLHNDGLVHISKMSHEFIKNPLDVVNVGDIVTCYVDDIDIEKEKVSLSLINN